MRVLSKRLCSTISLLIFVFLPFTVFAQYQPTPGAGQDYPFPGARPWDLSIRAFIGYNDNVPLVPHSTACGTPGGGPCAPGSFYGGFSIDGSYRLIRTDYWLAGVGLSFDQTAHTHNIGPACCTTDGRDFNLTALSPSAFARYFFDLDVGSSFWLGSAGMAYSYRRNWLPPAHSGLLWQTNMNTVQWDVAVNPIRQLRVGINYSLSFQDFNPAVTLNARDATVHAVGLSGTYSFQGGLRTITLGYQYGASDARSSNFEVQNSNGIKAQFKTLVYGPVWLALEAGSTWEDYNGFTGSSIPPPGRKWQRIENYGAQVVYVFTPHIQLDLFYKYTGWVSNQRQFEASRNNGGMGVTYRF
jgi:hypothetical protein